MFKLLLIVCITSILLIGCDQGRGTNVMDIMTDAATDSDEVANSETNTETPEPIDYVSIDGETWGLFTSADAAINSEEFRFQLENAKEYNQEYCDKDQKPDFSADSFRFIDENSAKEFMEKVNSEYSEHFVAEEIDIDHIVLLPTCL